VPLAETDSDSTPSALLLNNLEALRSCSALGPSVDLACGRGRNALALCQRGLDVVGVDRNAGFLAALQERAATLPGRAQTIRADLETGDGIPFAPGSCGAILVFRFLFRPLAPAIVSALAPGGLLFYETFTTDQTRHGWGPRRAEFLLAPGELPQLFPQLEVLHFDEEPQTKPRPEASARLLARLPG
jgi:SAM-dependent methyltransferase